MLERLFIRARELENPNTPLTSTNLLAALGGVETEAGMNVNEAKALRHTAVWACQRVIAESVAALPFPVYRAEGRSRERAYAHAVHRLLNVRPNPEMTAITFREVLNHHLVGWGNGYAEIVWSNGGDPLELWPLPPDRTEPERVIGEGGRKIKVLHVRLNDGQRVTLKPGKYLHIPGLGFDGMRGYSPIAMAREAIGAGLAAEKFGATWFGQGSHMGGIVKLPAGLRDPGKRNALAEQLRQWYSGPDRAHRLAVFEEDMDYKPTAVPPEEAQFIETRQFSVVEICRIYRMQPHKIAHLINATFSNIEHQGLEHVTDTLLPYLVRWEQTVNYELFNPLERETHFAEHVVEGLLRGDTQARGEFYSKMFQIGAMSPNEIRDKENLNPYEGGDDFRAPLNTDVVGTAADALRSSIEAVGALVREIGERRPALPAAPVRRSAEGRRRIQKAFLPVFRRAAERFVSAEIKALTRILESAFAGSSPVEDFIEAIERLYQTFPEQIRRELLPVLDAMAKTIRAEIEEEMGGNEIPFDEGVFLDDYAGVYEARHVGSSTGQIGQLLIESEDPHTAIAQRLAEWSETRAAKIAMNESVRTAGALTRTLFFAAGVSGLVWATFGDSCPLCNRMRGRRVAGVSEFFLKTGDVVEPGVDGVKPLTARSNVGHPPLHGGCDCGLIPG